MGNALGQIFIDPTTLPAGGYGFIQLLGLTAVYGKLIFDGSCLISDGSELLLLVGPNGHSPVSKPVRISIF